MVKRALDIVNIEKIATTNDVLDKLQWLDSRLGDLGLGSFQLFNTAYCIVTRRILDAISDGSLKDSNLIDTFVVIFAGYYFKALNNIVAGELKNNSPWAAMGEYAKITSPPVFLSLLLGANAHINYDLPQALKELMQDKMDGEELKELAVLNKILMESGKEIVGSFEEKNRLYDFMKRRLRWMYYRPAMYTILYWRIIAWQNYKHYRYDEKALSRITNHSSKIARRLVRLARIL